MFMSSFNLSSMWLQKICFESSIVSCGFVDDNAFVIDKGIPELADQKQADAFTKELEKCNADVASA